MFNDTNNSSNYSGVFHLTSCSLIDMNAAEVDDVDLRQRQELQGHSVLPPTVSFSPSTVCIVRLHTVIGTRFPLHEELRMNLSRFTRGGGGGGGILTSCMAVVV